MTLDPDADLCLFFAPLGNVSMVGRFLDLPVQLSQVDLVERVLRLRAQRAFSFSIERRWNSACSFWL
jgi:hypothetical protein